MPYYKKPIRRSQLITPWGVGAIVPFPDDESLMIAGLDMWRFGKKKDEFIVKDIRLEKRLKISELRKPPDYRDSNDEKFNKYLKIPSVRFPRWHYCPFCGTMSKSSYYSIRERCDGFEWKNGRRCDISKFQRKLIPERFIVVCPSGHIDDFPIMEWVHNNPKNKKKITKKCRLRRSTGGASASLTGVFYECTCGAKRSMAGAFNDGALKKNGYICRGSKPWLGIEKDNINICERDDVKVVQRGGTNVWFPNVISSLYIPLVETDDSRRLQKIADENYEKIVSRMVDGKLDKTYIEILAEIKNVDKDELFKLIKKRYFAHRIIDNKEKSEDGYRYEEYSVLIKNSGNDKIDFYCHSKSIDNYDKIFKNYFSSISLVYKLRETRAFVGFSRLQPDSGKSIKEMKKMLSLDGVDWLPAIEVFGEGIFFRFSSKKLDIWAKQTNVIDRVKKIDNSIKNSFFTLNYNNELNPAYVLIHTFAHIVINQLSYECGYGSSSLRERIYCEKEKEKSKMNGVLIYTASGDSEGSLGGLVRQGKPGRIENTIIAAIQKAKWCSSDPICINSSGQGPDSCNLAACYNCALVSETSCENSNRILDRALLVGTIEDKNIGFFNIDDI